MPAVASGGSHTRQLGPSEDHMDPLELGRGLGVETAEQSEADPAGLPSPPRPVCISPLEWFLWGM